MVEDENLLLALFAGGEERDEKDVLKPREERLRLARIRRDAAAAGIDTDGAIVPSVREMAASAHALASKPRPANLDDVAMAFEQGGKFSANYVRNGGQR